MTTDTATWVGEELAGGRYVVTAKLGEGGMGFIYRAHDPNLDCEVVIKVPRATILEEPEFGQRFVREIRSLVRLSHPHIVKITDAGEHGGFPFAVLPFLPGGTVRDRQPRDEDGKPLPLTPRELAGWLADIAAALDFIHEQRYIHRDVKPDNILFDASGKAFLSDFGVAKILAEKTETKTQTCVTGAGMVLGTPQYMAPELVMGKAYDGRVDQYALAIMIFELLSGQYPFDGPTAPAIFVKQSTEEPPLLSTAVPGASPALAQAIRRGMAKDPAERFSTCAALAKAVLQAAGEGPIVRASAPSQIPRAPKSTSVKRAPTSKAVCPACNHSFAIAERSQGNRVRCPSCQRVLQTAARPHAVLTGRPAETSETRQVKSTRAEPTLPSEPVSPPAREDRVKTPLDPYLMAEPHAARKHFRLMVAGGLGLLLLAGMMGLFIGLTRSRPTKGAREPEPPVVAENLSLAPAPVEPSPNAEPVRPAVRFVLDEPPQGLRVEAGKVAVLRVHLERKDYPGPIQLEIRGLPDKVECKPATLTGAEDTAELTLRAAGSASEVWGPIRLVVVGDSQIEERKIRLEVSRPIGKSVPGPVARAIPKPTPPRVAPLPDRIGSLRIFAQDDAACAAFSADGRRALTGYKNGLLILWDATTGEEAKRLTERVASPTPAPVAKKGRKPPTPVDPTTAVRAIAFAPDGRKAAVGYRDGSIIIWDLESRSELGTLIGHRRDVLRLAYSADGQRLLSSADDSTARLWDAHTNRHLQTFTEPGKALYGVGISANGNQVITAGWNPAGGPEANALRLWDATNGTQTDLLTGHTRTVRSVVFLPDGQRAATSGIDNTLRLWNVKNGRTLKTLNLNQAEGCLSLSLAPDGSHLLAGGQDTTIRVIDLERGEEVYQFAHSGPVHALGWSANSRRALAFSPGKGILIWGLPAPTPVRALNPAPASAR